MLTQRPVLLWVVARLTGWQMLLARQNPVRMEKQYGQQFVLFSGVSMDYVCSLLLHRSMSLESFASQPLRSVSDGSGISQRSQMYRVLLIVPIFESLCERLVWEELGHLLTEEEFTQVVAQLSNNAAPGESGILLEMVQHGSDVLFSHILSLVQQAWCERGVPSLGGMLN